MYHLALVRPLKGPYKALKGPYNIRPLKGLIRPFKALKWRGQPGYIPQILKGVVRGLKGFIRVFIRLLKGLVRVLKGFIRPL